MREEKARRGPSDDRAAEDEVVNDTTPSATHTQIDEHPISLTAIEGTPKIRHTQYNSEGIEHPSTPTSCRRKRLEKEINASGDFESNENRRP